MIERTRGNVLDADVEALVNTVNTVGVMGKGVALQFREAFPENFRLYRAACERGEVELGKMFITETSAVSGPRWIVNFPTKQHWRSKTRIEWIERGLVDLRSVVEERGISSIALPPLGCGQGGLSWSTVRPLIEGALADLAHVRVLLYEPTKEYQNVAKRGGVEKLTPARALIAELVRRYWVLGIPCSLLEIQKLAWFVEREVVTTGLPNPLDLRFVAHKYGPYSDRLRHLLDGLDGSYLRSEVRIADATPSDVIAFDDSKREHLAAYLRTEAREYLGALESTSKRIDGFQSPLGMELLATVDWLLAEDACPHDIKSLREAMGRWHGGRAAGRRKLRLFDDRLLGLALERLCESAAGADSRIPDSR